MSDDKGKKARAAREKLHGGLLNDKYTDYDYNKFETVFSKAESQQNLYNKLKQIGKIKTMTFPEFQDHFFFDVNSPTTQTPSVELKVPGTDDAEKKKMGAYTWDNPTPQETPKLGITGLDLKTSLQESSPKSKGVVPTAENASTDKEDAANAETAKKQLEEAVKSINADRQSQINILDKRLAAGDIDKSMYQTLVDQANSKANEAISQKTNYVAFGKPASMPEQILAAGMGLSAIGKLSINPNSSGALLREPEVVKGISAAVQEIADDQSFDLGKFPINLGPEFYDRVSDEEKEFIKQTGKPSPSLVAKIKEEAIVTKETETLWEQVKQKKNPEGDVEQAIAKDAGLPGYSVQDAKIDQIVAELPYSSQLKSRIRQQLIARSDAAQYTLKFEDKLAESAKKLGMELPDEKLKKFGEEYNKLKSKYEQDLAAINSGINAEGKMLQEQQKTAMQKYGDDQKAAFLQVHAELKAKVEQGLMTPEDAQKAAQAHLDQINAGAAKIQEEFTMRHTALSDKYKAQIDKQNKFEQEYAALQKDKGVFVSESGTVSFGKDYENEIQALQGSVASQMQVEEKINKEIAWNSLSLLDKASTSIAKGVIGIAESLGAGAKYFMPGSETADWALHFLDDVRKELPEKDFTKQSFRQNLTDLDFYIATLGEQVPLMIPSMGAGSIAAKFVNSFIGKNLALSAGTRTAIASVAGAGASRWVEGTMEAGGVFLDAIKSGKSYAEAYNSAHNVWDANKWLMLTDLLQYGMAYSKAPAKKLVTSSAYRPYSFMKSMPLSAGKFGVQMASEGIEEMIQEYFNAKEKSPFLTLADFAASKEGQQVFTVGAIMGGVFQSVEGKGDLAERQRFSVINKSITQYFDKLKGKDVRFEDIYSRHVMLQHTLATLKERGELDQDEYSKAMRDMSVSLETYSKAANGQGPLSYDDYRFATFHALTAEQQNAEDRIAELQEQKRKGILTTGAAQEMQLAEQRVKMLQSMTKDLVNDNKAHVYQIDNINLTKDEYDSIVSDQQNASLLEELAIAGKVKTSDPESIEKTMGIKAFQDNTVRSVKKKIVEMGYVDNPADIDEQVLGEAKTALEEESKLLDDAIEMNPARTDLINRRQDIQTTLSQIQNYQQQTSTAPIDQEQVRLAADAQKYVTEISPIGNTVPNEGELDFAEKRLKQERANLDQQSADISKATTIIKDYFSDKAQFSIQNLDKAIAKEERALEQAQKDGTNIAGPTSNLRALRRAKSQMQSKGVNADGTILQSQLDRRNKVDELLRGIDILRGKTPKLGEQKQAKIAKGKELAQKFAGEGQLTPEKVDAAISNVTAKKDAAARAKQDTANFDADIAALKAFKESILPKPKKEQAPAEQEQEQVQEQTPAKEQPKVEPEVIPTVTEEKAPSITEEKTPTTKEQTPAIETPKIEERPILKIEAQPIPVSEKPKTEPKEEVAPTVEVKPTEEKVKTEPTEQPQVTTKEPTTNEKTEKGAPSNTGKGTEKPTTETKPSDRPEPEPIRPTGGNKGQGNEPGLRPGLVYATGKESIPTPKDYVAKGQYDIDEDQRFAVNLALTRFYEKNGKGFLLADGTGVGKTRQILAIANEVAKRGKVVIITENQTIIDDAFANDAKAMGIDLKNPNIELGTYDGLRDKKVGQGDSYELAIYDEAHNMKNAESGKSIAGFNLSKKSKHELYATATPMDTPAGAVYFASKVTPMNEDQVYAKLGFRVDYPVNPDTGVAERKISLSKETNPKDVLDNIIELRNEIIADGAMLRREYPFYGTIEEADISMNSEQEDQHAEISEYWDMVEAEAGNENGSVSPKRLMVIRGNRSNEFSRWTESQKVNAVYQMVLKKIAEGKRVVLVSELINPTNIKGLGQEVQGFIGALEQKLQAKGISIARIYGDNKKSDEVRKFQGGQAQVVLMTPKSGGTGINLDDVVGDAPRTLIMVTPNYSGNLLQQILGRVSRRNTKSPAEAIMVYMNSESDNKRKQIVKRKLETLRAIQNGVLDEADIELADYAANEPTEVRMANITFEDISPKAFVVKGDTKPIKDKLSDWGGVWNGKQKAWMFPMTKKEEIRKKLEELSQSNQPKEEVAPTVIEQKPEEKTEQPTPKIEKQPIEKIEQLPTEKPAAELPVQEQVPTKEEDTPQGAIEDRKRGYKIIKGVKYIRQTLTNIVKGISANIRFSNKKGGVEKGYYAIMEAEDLIPSHRRGKEYEPHFIPEAQPKDRTVGEAMAKGDTVKASTLQPDSLGISPTAFSGAPTMNARGEVVQGNGRAASIMLYYEQYDDGRYQQWLKENAQTVGISQEDLAKFKRPVLVRIMDVNDDRAIELGQFPASELEDVASRASITQAKFRRMTKEERAYVKKLLLENAELDDTLNSAIRAVAKKVLSYLAKIGIIAPGGTEMNIYKDIETDNLTTEGAFMLEQLFSQYIFESDKHPSLATMFESLPYNLKDAISNGAMLPLLMVNKNAASIIPDFQDAMVIFKAYSRRESPKTTSLDQWLDTLNITDDAQVKTLRDIFKITPDQENLLRLFDAVERLGKKKGNRMMADFMEGYVEKTSDQQSADIFAETIPGMGKSEAIQELLNEIQGNDTKTNVTGNKGTSNLTGTPKESKSAGRQEQQGEPEEDIFNENYSTRRPEKKSVEDQQSDNDLTGTEQNKTRAGIGPGMKAIGLDPVSRDSIEAIKEKSGIPKELDMLNNLRRASKVFFDKLMITPAVQWASTRAKAAIGSFSRATGQIKVQTSEDAHTLIHEIGHLIDAGYMKDGFYLKDAPKEVQDELMKFAPFGSAPPTAKQARGVAKEMLRREGLDPTDKKLVAAKIVEIQRNYELGEGFAEFFRAWMINPSKALQEGGKIFDYFKQAVESQAKNNKGGESAKSRIKALEDMSYEVRLILSLNPAEQAASKTGMSAIQSESKSMAAKLKEAWDSLMFRFGFKNVNGEYYMAFWDKFTTFLLDEAHPLDKAVKTLKKMSGEENLSAFDSGEIDKNPYLLAKLLHGFNDKIKSMFEDGLRMAQKDKQGNMGYDIAYDGDDAMTLDWLVAPLADQGHESWRNNSTWESMKKMDSDKEYAQNLMRAQRTIEIAKRLTNEVMEPVAIDSLAQKGNKAPSGQDIKDEMEILMQDAAIEMVTQGTIPDWYESAQKATNKQGEQGRFLNANDRIKLAEATLALKDNINPSTQDIINEIASQPLRLDGISGISVMGGEGDIQFTKLDALGNPKTISVKNTMNGDYFNSIAIEEEHKSKPKEYQKRINEFARRYREYADVILEYAVAHGLLSQEQFDDIKANNAQYISLKRIYEEELGVISDKFSPVKNQPIRNTNGKLSTLNHVSGYSYRSIEEPVESLLANLIETVRKADRNYFLAQFTEMLKGDAWGIADTAFTSAIGTRIAPTEVNSVRNRPDTIRVFRDGVEEYWQIKDPDVKQAIDSVLGFDNAGPIARQLIKTLRWTIGLFPRAVSYMTTQNPVFALTNYIRDRQARFLFSKSTMGQALKSKMTSNKAPGLEFANFPSDFQAYGGGQSGYSLYFSGPEAYNKALYYAMQKTARKGKNFMPRLFDIGGRIVKSPAQIGWFNNYWTEWAERKNRIGEYQKAFKKYKAKGFSDYSAAKAAALEARGLMDFAVQGRIAKVMSNLIPFFNATVQGTRKFYSWLDSFVGDMTKAAKGDKAALNRSADGFVRFSLLALGAMVPNIIARSLGYEDEYEELPANERDLFYNFKMGKGGEWWDGFFRIPKSQEMAAFTSFFDRLYSYSNGNENAFGGYKKNASGDSYIGGTFLKGLIPFAEENWWANFTGTAKPFFEIGLDYDIFRQRKIKGGEGELDISQRERWKNSSHLAYMLHGTWGWDAREIDHLIDSWLGYYGRIGQRAINTLVDIERDMPVAEARQFKGEDAMTTVLKNIRLFREDTPYALQSVQWLIDKATKYDLKNTNDYKTLMDMAQGYKNDQTDRDLSNVISYAKSVRSKWEDKIKLLENWALSDKSKPIEIYGFEVQEMKKSDVRKFIFERPE